MDLWKKFLRLLDKKTEDFGTQYKTFALFVIISYPLAYFTNYYIGFQKNENGIIRLIAFLLCIPLLFTNHWPVNIKKYLNFYWFSTLLYSLPFLATYMLLQNHMSMEWLMNIILGLFLLILLVDWMMFIILLSLGILLGYLCFIASGQDIEFEMSFSEISLISYLYFYAIIIGLVFSRSHERTHQEKLNTMKMLAGSIAHELRTPLSAMMMGAQNLGRLLQIYKDGYGQAKEAKLPVQKMTPSQEHYLSDLPESMYTVSQNAHTMITMLLTNLSGGGVEKKLEACSMAHCVRETLETYPFSEDERPLLHWESSQYPAMDFTFLGHKELIKHVLFNLLKNALYAIAAAGKGEIFITLKPSGGKGNKTNQLIFKDTGPGIPSKNLRHIFNRFYTKTEHGTGIGLAFCQSVIQSFGGEITCTSEQDKHTTFTISLPMQVEEKCKV